jgi:hypothetical protein
MEVAETAFCGNALVSSMGFEASSRARANKTTSTGRNDQTRGMYVSEQA